jgi:hypothetical protein
VGQIVYVDEAGIDNRDQYPYGYSKVGQRFYALRAGKQTERVSWSAALKQGKLIAPMTFCFLARVIEICLRCGCRSVSYPNCNRVI